MHLKSTNKSTTFLAQFGTSSLERVKKAVQCLQSGKGILLVDNENRENEGDLIFPAESMSIKNMALMIRECSGIVCLCLTQEKADELQLMPMTLANTSRFHTAFTVSIEAKMGVTTGVSAKDRITTIQTACADGATGEQLAKPGHIFPLVAKHGGVLERPGHTEGSVDLMRIADLKPMAVLCELTNEDGTMATLNDIASFANTHQLTVLSVEDIINYRKFEIQ